MRIKLNVINTSRAQTIYCSGFRGSNEDINWYLCRRNCVFIKNEEEIFFGMLILYKITTTTTTTNNNNTTTATATITTTTNTTTTTTLSSLHNFKQYCQIWQLGFRCVILSAKIRNTIYMISIYERLYPVLIW
jgi:hypothetical protein